MKHAALLVLALALSALPAMADEYELGALPTTVDEFLALRDRIATTPEGGAVTMLAALMTLSRDKELGMAFLTIALDQSNLSTGAAYKGYKPGAGAMFHIERLLEPSRARAPFSYVLGTVPGDGYAASPPYRFGISRNQYSVIDEKTVKVFIACSGAASPRPMTLRRNDKGLWKVLEFSSFSLDVAAPLPSDDL